jgi:hypothetical protein
MRSRSSVCALPVLVERGDQIVIEGNHPTTGRGLGFANDHLD